jgi:hypothetical protein
MDDHRPDTERRGLPHLSLADLWDGLEGAQGIDFKVYGPTVTFGEALADSLPPLTLADVIEFYDPIVFTDDD